MKGSDSRFVQGALTLTVAGLLVKAMGALYRIPLYTILGSEGMGLFQMAYPIYAILFTVSSAGLNVAISKVVAERWAVGSPGAARKAFRCSLILALVLGALGGLLLYWMSGPIASHMGKDPRARLSVAAISPAVLTAAVLSAFRGWFQGIEKMIVPALSQILEQLVKIITTLAFATLFMPKGVEYAAAGATLGAVVGATVAAVFVSFAYCLQGNKWIVRERVERGGEADASYISVGLEIIRIAVPISLASAVFGITELVDLGLVPGRLQASGCTPSQATTLFGQLTGAAFPLINIPTMFTGALQMTLVPSVAAALATGDRKKAHRLIDRALSMALVLALPAALGLYVLAQPIPALLFKDEGLGGVVRSVTPAVFFLALQQVTSGILQGLGKVKAPLYSLLWAVCLKAPLSYVLVAQPGLGVVGAGLATSAYFAVAALLNLKALDQELGYCIEAKTFLKAALAAGVMALCTGKTFNTLSAALGWKSGVIGAILVGVVVYGIMVCVLGLVPLGVLFTGSTTGIFKRRKRK